MRCWRKAFHSVFRAASAACISASVAPMLFGNRKCWGLISSTNAGRSVQAGRSIMRYASTNDISLLTSSRIPSWSRRLSDADVLVGRLAGDYCFDVLGPKLQRVHSLTQIQRLVVDAGHAAFRAADVVQDRLDD